MNFSMTTATYMMLCAFALLVLSVSAELAHSDDGVLDMDKRGPYRAFAFAKRSEEEFDKRAQYGFAKRSPYRTFAFAKRARPYGFAFAKRSQFSSFA
ncbi:unnamed protein product [Caenorhabditis bovis]|uniref:Uncharacterized protein n=1 Tax=Caenorhabditis bovis TaxID=2654633 RepID=A0A8S1EPU3_9PELO|nr:unnamed protein product [Caenorhabditis bovis]